MSNETRTTEMGECAMSGLKKERKSNRCSAPRVRRHGSPYVCNRDGLYRFTYVTCCGSCPCHARLALTRHTRDDMRRGYPHAPRRDARAPNDRSARLRLRPRAKAPYMPHRYSLPYRIALYLRVRIRHLGQSPEPCPPERTVGLGGLTGPTAPKSSQPAPMPAPHAEPAVVGPCSCCSGVRRCSPTAQQSNTHAHSHKHTRAQTYGRRTRDATR